jgi:ethanolamine ammonia-lyase large subunit
VFKGDGIPWTFYPYENFGIIILEPGYRGNATEQLQVGGICPFSNRAAPISAKTVTVEIVTYAPPQLRQHYFLLLMNSTFTFLAVEYYYSKPQIVSPSPH